MIKIELIGNIGKDAETITIGGNTYASFTIAVSDQVKGEEKTTWYRAMKSDKDGKLVPHLTKGKKLFICGKPTISACISQKTNTAVGDLTIWINELVFCGGGSKEEKKHEPIPEPTPEPESDDLPF
jgi:hypothetical protein